jgi:glyoxylase-like metal-dependent hydrolase (beta-lactamase superfamily II)
VLHFPEHDALFAGDQLCTLNPLTGERGPQLLPSALQESTAGAMESLSRFEDAEAILLPGHGDPWEGSVAAAVAQARERGPT